jgi:NAD(P)-dependent dehydrogenase (short-subunit alcohol dehydrogenase family)
MAAETTRVALVTGAGQGIGRAIAVQLAKDGYRVLINDIVANESDTERGAYEAKRIIESDGGAADVYRADIASPDERRAMVEHVANQCGRIDLLVNNAGVAPKERKDILEATEESFERLISVNLQGPYFLTQLVANHMIAWKEAGVIETPRIVFISSISAYTSSPSRGEYCVSKAGVAMAAKLFADRLGEYGIPVLDIAPGIIETPMTAGVKDKYDKLIAEGLLITKRWGQGEDIARVVSAFGQGLLDYCTGQQIEVGGGFGLTRL